MGNLTRMVQGESRRMIRRAFAALLLSPAVAQAQERTSASPRAPAIAPARLDLGGAILADGDELRYLRDLSLLDTGRTASLLIQPFGQRAERAWRSVTTRAEHPWTDRFAAIADSRFQPRDWHGIRVSLLRPDALVRFNSALPSTATDGVIWAGRGATLGVQAGAAFEWRWLRGQLAPVIFRAQNADFAIAPTGRTGPLAYADPRFPTNIDLPQRFGDATYGRLDLGDSFVEASALGFSLGLSNARQHWGPARRYPMVLGTNSGGFAHGFVGTDGPLDIGIGQIQARLVTGRLEQSPYSSVQSGQTARFFTGFIGAFSPRFFPGLEAGAIRIVNGAWPQGGIGIGEVTRVFQGVISDNVSSINMNNENQFASLFIRLAPPGSGFEAYGEMTREDFAGNWRWLWMQPDDLMDYVLGLARTRLAADGALHTVRLELVNGETSHQERLGRRLIRPIPPYTHGRTPQGLTNRGQLLGSPEAYSGAGGIIAWDRRSARGRRTIALERALIRDWVRGMATPGVPWAEVRYGARAEVVRFRGDRELGLVVAPSWTLNHNLERGADIFDIAVQLRWRGW